MQKKLTITIDEDVYAGLYQVVGKRKISRFIESLVRPHVMYGDIREGYRQMAADTERETEAMEWSGGQPDSIPVFQNEAEERAFWEANDSSGHIDWTRAKRARLVNLRPSTKSISLRLPLPLLEQIKIAANQRDVPYQSLIKVWLSERVKAK